MNLPEIEFRVGRRDVGRRYPDLLVQLVARADRRRTEEVLDCTKIRVPANLDGEHADRHCNHRLRQFVGELAEHCGLGSAP